MLVRKTVTALFCDVADSTGLGERLDPESHRRVMTRYFEVMQKTIERHGGTVEKFVGDAVMALFGVPVVHEDDALRAVRASVEMRTRLHELNEELGRNYGVRLEISIGINTGEVVTGGETVGGTLATGDAINVAARLQQAAAPGEILVGTATYPLVKDAVRVGPRKTYTVKGKAQGVQTWQLQNVDAGAAGIARRLDAELVDRKEDLQRMRACFDAAVANRGCELLTIVGNAGIGKSRLAGELLSVLGDEASALTGRCLPYGDGITFWPITDVVRQLGGPERLEAVLAEDGGKDTDLIAARVRGAVGAGPAAGAPEDTFWAVRRLLEAVARKRPLVVCFEDIHWAEPTFLDLIEYLVGWSRSAPILLLCLARPELLEERPAWLAPWPNATTLQLDGLSASDADALVEALGGGAELSNAVRARIAQVAEGNPLFVEQMVAMATESDPLDWSAVPPSIQALLAERLDRLAPDERAVIERAAIIGREFPQSAVLELCPPELRASGGSVLLALVRKGLIAPDAAWSRFQDGFRFRHILIRDGAYGAMPREVRAELHERFGEWVERNVGHRLPQLDEIVGFHLEQALAARAALGPLDEEGRRLALAAAQRLRSAGLGAYTRGDLPAAVNLLTRATVLLKDEDELRIRLAPELAHALVETGELRQAERVLTQAIELARAHGDRQVEARSLAEYASLQLFIDPRAWELALPEARRAMAELAEFGDDAGLARAWTNVLLAYYWRGRVEEMEAAAERAFEHAWRAHDERQISTVLNARIRAALVGPLAAPEAIERCERLAAELPTDRSLTGVAFAARAYLEAMQGHVERARSLGERSRVLLEDLGRSRLIAALRAYTAAVELLADDPAGAERELRAGIETLEAIGDRGNLGTHGALLAHALFEQGRMQEAQEWVELSANTAGSDDVFSQVGLRTASARVEASSGSVDAARETALEAVALAEETDCPELRGAAAFALGHVLAAAGEAEAAAEAFTHAAAHYEAKGNVVAAGRARAAPTHSRPSGQSRSTTAGSTAGGDEGGT